MKNTEISVSNHGMLSGLQSRKHQIDKVYACGEAADDLILIGKVTWVLKDGQQLDGSFAARAVVVQKDSERKLSLYQGWAVCFPPEIRQPLPSFNTQCFNANSRTRICRSYNRL